MKVSVFGAGVAGLTVAHEFSALGHDVDVYETNDQAGGFFRSRMKDGIASEYSWHGFAPWYHNTFDLVRQLDVRLSEGIEWAVVPDDSPPIYGVPRMFRMTPVDHFWILYVLGKVWSTDRRSREQYALVSAADTLKPLLSRTGYKTFVATFGPWIGSDWTNVSLHHMGHFFRKNMIGVRNTAWKLLRGPSNDVWFDPWVEMLRNKGVRFHFRSSLVEMQFDDVENRITGAIVEDQQGPSVVRADMYVVATNPYAAAEVIARTPELARRPQLRLLKPLTQNAPHTQVSFRLIFADEIRFPKPRTAFILTDSEFNLTLFAQEQVWYPDYIAPGVGSLWTGTSCVGTVPGKLHGQPVETCTRKEFEEEVLYQIYRSAGLHDLLTAANNGKSLRDFHLVGFEVWHEWRFSRSGIIHAQPKWVNSVNTQPYEPEQITDVSNLRLAGAHTRTDADLWSVEAAVESGRRAAGVTVIPQQKMIISTLDNMLYSRGMPHVVLLITVVVLFVSNILSGH